MEAISNGTARLRTPCGQFILIDECDLPLVSGYFWCLTNKGYVHAWDTSHVGRGRKRVRLHRLILGFPACSIDHRNRNKLDNRRSNLRLASGTQNNANQLKRNGACTSRYRGVHFNASRKRWVAKVACGGKVHWAGSTHRTALSAALAYDAAAVKFFGEFAAPNFPERFRNAK